MVADNDSGKSIKSEARTSSGMFLQKAQVLYVNPFSFLYLRTSFELLSLCLLNSLLSARYRLIAIAFLSVELMIHINWQHVAVNILQCLE
jgi:hypothetical protein